MTFIPIPYPQWGTSNSSTGYIVEPVNFGTQQNASYIDTGEMLVPIDTTVADFGEGQTNASNQSGITNTQEFCAMKANVLNVTAGPPPHLDLARDTAWDGQPRHAAPKAGAPRSGVGGTQALLSRRLAARRNGGAR
ncbi:MAG: hypothetical protein ABSA80_00345 [Terriglobales bacterium]|jgi:hypothetical protein